MDKRYFFICVGLWMCELPVWDFGLKCQYKEKKQSTFYISGRRLSQCPRSEVLVRPCGLLQRQEFDQFKGKFIVNYVSLNFKIVYWTCQVQVRPQENEAFVLRPFFRLKVAPDVPGKRRITDGHSNSTFNPEIISFTHKSNRMWTLEYLLPNFNFKLFCLPKPLFSKFSNSTSSPRHVTFHTKSDFARMSRR